MTAVRRTLGALYAWAVYHAWQESFDAHARRSPLLLIREDVQ